MYDVTFHLQIHCFLLLVRLMSEMQSATLAWDDTLAQSGTLAWHDILAQSGTLAWHDIFAQNNFKFIQIFIYF